MHRKAGPGDCNRKCTLRVPWTWASRPPVLRDDLYMHGPPGMASYIPSGRALRTSFRGDSHVLGDHCRSGISFRLAAAHLGDNAVNAAVGAATAKVPANAVSDLLLGSVRMLVQKRL